MRYIDYVSPASGAWMRLALREFLYLSSRDGADPSAAGLMRPITHAMPGSAAVQLNKYVNM
jgi:hypothetical protein